MRRRIAVVALLSSLGVAQATPTRSWMAVTLDGRKIGKMLVERDVRGDEVLTTQTIDLRVSRGKTPLVVHNEVEATESATGEPRAFRASSLSSSRETRIDAHRRDDGRFQVATTVGGQSTVNLLAWPEGAALSEGQRLAIVSHGFAPGTRYQVRNFDATKQQVATLDVEVVGDEVVELPGGNETLHHLRQGLSGTDSARRLDLWVDDAGNLRKGLSPMFGLHMEMVACDESCANAPEQDLDVLRSSMVLAPRAMSNLRVLALRYTVTVKGEAANPLVTTDEQQVKAIREGVYDVTIGDAQAHEESAPSPEDLAANPWVQSNAPEVLALATKTVGDATTDLQRMRRLRSFLSDYIDQTGLDVGYASALETLHTRRGDCTEHAVLLAALGRSLGIPTRIVTGLVYADRFAGASHVFVPHTWVQSWIDDRWVSFDSAQRRFDATHIALGVGSGDPWRFFSAMASLGRIQIDRAVPVGGLPNMPPPPVMRTPPREPTIMPTPVNPPKGGH
jgi:transglutaminase-like putative cysteine protease